MYSTAQVLYSVQFTYQACLVFNIHPSYTQSVTPTVSFYGVKMMTKSNGIAKKVNDIYKIASPHNKPCILYKAVKFFF